MEKLSICLNNAQIIKKIKQEYNQNKYLDDLILKDITYAKTSENIVIVDGYAFKIDRSVPKIEKYLAQESTLVFPEVDVKTTITQEKTTIMIKAKEEKME